MNEIYKMIVHEASRWVGITEVKDNSGQLIELFQKSVNGLAQKEPWCLSFVVYCLKNAIATFKAMNIAVVGVTCPLDTKHVMTFFNKSLGKHPHPSVGSIAIWRHYKDDQPTLNGHCGIVTKVNFDDTFETIEGNTSDTNSVNREGDGVYRKVRHIKSTGNMKLIGFIDPFQKIIS